MDHASREEHMSDGPQNPSQSLFGPLGDLLSKRRPWYKLPTLLAIPQLLKMRNELREKNLHDTEEPPFERRDSNQLSDPAAVQVRTVDGTSNDLEFPKMGSAGCRFGRNFPLQHTFPDSAN